MKENVAWSRYVKVITVVSIVLFMVIAFKIGVVDGSVKWMNYVVDVIMLLATGYAIYMSPNKVELTDDCLIVHKLIGKMVIPFDIIDEARVYQTTMADVRVFGCGGFFGHTGLFRNKDIGKYTAYVGRYADTFLVVTSFGKKYVLSCENKEKIVDVLNGKLRKKKK